MEQKINHNQERIEIRMFVRDQKVPQPLEDSLLPITTREFNVKLIIEGEKSKNISFSIDDRFKLERNGNSPRLLKLNEKYPFDTEISYIQSVKPDADFQVLIPIELESKERHRYQAKILTFYKDLKTLVIQDLYSMHTIEELDREGKNLSDALFFDQLINGLPSEKKVITLDMYYFMKNEQEFNNIMTTNFDRFFKGEAVSSQGLYEELYNIASVINMMLYDKSNRELKVSYRDAHYMRLDNNGIKHSISPIRKYTKQTEIPKRTFLNPDYSSLENTRNRTQNNAKSIFNSRITDLKADLCLYETQKAILKYAERPKITAFLHYSFNGVQHFYPIEDPLDELLEKSIKQLTFFVKDKIYYKHPAFKGITDNISPSKIDFAVIYRMPTESNFNEFLDYFDQSDLKSVMLKADPIIGLVNNTKTLFDFYEDDLDFLLPNTKKKRKLSKLLKELSSDLKNSLESGVHINEDDITKQYKGHELFVQLTKDYNCPNNVSVFFTNALIQVEDGHTYFVD